MNVTVVTGASQNHIKSLHQLIASFVKHRESQTNLVVQNLGILENDWESLQKKFPDVTQKIFNFNDYPSYVNIENEAGQQAWKPIIIANTCTDFPGEIVVWMDAGNIIMGSLQDFAQMVKNDNLHSGITHGTVSRWTHPGTLKYMNCSEQYLTNRNRNGACVAFDTNVVWVRQFIEEWKELALTQECIAPDGSNRSNHRQDQAVLTILYYKYQEKHSFSESIFQTFRQYTIHNDVD